MYQVPFLIGNHLYNSTPNPTAVQLYGGPLLGSIVSITVYKNLADGGGTSGQLPKKNRLAYITASPDRFSEVCEAIDGGEGCTLWVSYDVVNGRREVDDIWVELTVLQQINHNVAKTATTTREIYDVVSERLDQLVGEVTRTNDLLRERLPQHGSAPATEHASGPTTDLPPQETTNGGKQLTAQLRTDVRTRP